MRYDSRCSLRYASPESMGGASRSAISTRRCVIRTALTWSARSGTGVNCPEPVGGPSWGSGKKKSSGPPPASLIVTIASPQACLVTP